MDYSKIVADESLGTAIGRLYADTPQLITPDVRAAYSKFAREVTRQFDALPIKVEFQREDPYETAEQMFADVRFHGRLKVYMTAPDQVHPVLSPWQNNRFRAVHDYYGHFLSGRDFSRHGEEAAWWAHRQMFRGLAARAMTSETRGQSSAFVWLNGGREFPPQKAVLLPRWVSNMPPVGSDGMEWG